MSKLDEILKKYASDLTWAGTRGFEVKSAKHANERAKQQLKDWALEQRIDELELVLEMAEDYAFIEHADIIKRLAELRKQIRGENE